MLCVYVVFNKETSMTIICPITNTNNKFHLHVLLDGRTKTFGVALFKQSKALDVEVCDYRFVEMVPGDILENVIDIVFTELKF
ncbi:MULTISPECIES: type II toxin-antitoxin system PemK/MazF family toxin [Eubacterium]|nr:type II toxin-antitoxin system PemK/MazF family toxin [Eubacterium callanderi]MCB6658050.1 type II toxin-antitoxin system PemK/MazF family toxin [Eubacterium callanderi]MCB6750666.1 type II toxin-antitoxin system PemK/MazF family toxin [Eubacterium callanderi]MCB7102282.1 type II toxin-antitoxin system PemK/MazF family toxin [Eubacterium callanderi]MCQ4819361.1 type II toxin-antitoxin system PemK/MazF family toxin [Eubacterium callanderi]MCQ4823394.1 type II toxin-antitoxin system PemK/MazF